MSQHKLCVWLPRTPPPTTRHRLPSQHQRQLRATLTRGLRTSQLPCHLHSAALDWHPVPSLRQVEGSMALRACSIYQPLSHAGGMGGAAQPPTPRCTPGQVSSCPEFLTKKAVAWGQPCLGAPALPMGKSQLQEAGFLQAWRLAWPWEEAGQSQEQLERAGGRADLPWWPAGAVAFPLTTCVLPKVHSPLDASFTGSLTPDLSLSCIASAHPFQSVRSPLTVVKVKFKPLAVCH